MNLFVDMLLVNKTSFKKSINSLIKNWVIIFTGVVYTLINLFMIIVGGTLFRGELSIIMGLIMAIVSSSLISNYLYLLYNIINYGRVNLEIFKEGFKHYLWKVYGVFFIAWIGNLALSMIGGMLGSNALLLRRIISIVILIALNPLPETLYQKYLSPGDSIRYALEFMNGNWVNWLIPNLFFHTALYFVTDAWIMNLFTIHIGFNFVFTVKGMGLYLLGQVMFSFIMVYRGHLFKLLSTSTPRKRMYMRNYY